MRTMTMVRSMGAALAMAALGAGCALLPANAASNPLMGEWEVADIDHAGVTDNAHLTVAFDETGRIYGSAGCNRYTGAYSFDTATGALKVTPLGVTRRLCPPTLMTQEGRLVQSLQGATRAETLSDGAVSIASSGGRTLLRRPTKASMQAAAHARKSAPEPYVAPSFDPLAPQTSAAASTPTAPVVSPTALPPPSTSTYALSGAPSDAGAAPLYTPPPAPPAAPTKPKPVATTSAVPVTPTVTPTVSPTVTPAVAPAPIVTPPRSPYALGPSPVSPRIAASGEIYFLEQVALPPDATVRVQLRDVSRVGAPATVLGQQEFPASGAQPFPFSVTAPSSVIDPHARLTLFAEILAGNRLLFITDTSNPVPVSGTSAPLRIRVVSAAPAPTRPVTPPATPPVTPTSTSALPVAPAPPPAIPHSVSWRCGAETFRLAFEAQIAFLTTADGAVARLTRINASDEPGAPQMYSNSILTVIRETEGAGRVRFARGRMALTTCTRAE